MLFNVIDNTLKIEEHCLDTIYETMKASYKGNKILFVSEPYIVQLYGSSVRNQLMELGNLKEEFVDDNSIAYAMALAERMIATDIDCIVGLGGGRVLDVCKYAAYISKRPFISLPTTVANDGIASPIAVLKKKDGKPKSLGAKTAEIILIDIALISRSPLGLIKSGIGDTISNHTALLDWEFACKNGKDRMNDFAYLMSQNSLDALMRTQYKTISTEFIKVLCNSLILSGLAMSFAGTSRPVSGSEHLFSHALDYYSSTTNSHGIQVALGTLSMLKLMEFDYQPVLDYLVRFGVEINPHKLGISQEDFVLCMQKAPSMRTHRYTYLNVADLSNRNLKKTYNWLRKELP